MILYPELSPHRLFPPYFPSGFRWTGDVFLTCIFLAHLISLSDVLLVSKVRNLLKIVENRPLSHLGLSHRSVLSNQMTGKSALSRTDRTFPQSHVIRSVRESDLCERGRVQESPKLL